MDNDQLFQERMLDVQGVAELLACSTRHIYRLADSGRMPRPVRLGRLVRWRQRELEGWIEDGCPKVRSWARVEKSHL